MAGRNTIWNNKLFTERNKNVQLRSIPKPKGPTINVNNVNKHKED